MQTLPIDALLPEIVESLRRAPALVVEAPPGAGKTTRVPSALLDSDACGGEVWVLEPRRIAARMAARRVAEERGEPLGETVGYQVRFENASGPRTRLRFLTEGVFTRRLLSDPQLSKVGCVVLDEFHERHLQADLALAVLRRLQLTARPDLRVVAMSATLDAAPVARFLGGCATVRSEGRLFSVDVEHLRRPDDRPLHEQVSAAVARLVAEGLDGDVLVFLPGAAEIRRAQASLAPLAETHGLLLLPLHGELPAAEQDRAVRPADRRKVVLSTNVAETSVTIEGVAAVIDSGLARVAAHSPWSGLPALTLARVSQASAAQRAGRAGRTRPGRCLRLYTSQDFAARPPFDEAEVRRADLAEAALELHAAGLTDLTEFEWFEPPPRHSLDAAEDLLLRLGAIDEARGLTERGAAMLRLPLHPRLARLVVEASARGVEREGCAVAALISERDIRERDVLADPRERRREATRHGPSDLLDLLDLFEEAERADFAPARLHALGLKASAVRHAGRARRQLLRALVRESRKEGEGSGGAGKGNEGRKGVRKEPSDAERAGRRESELLISILTGYPDRVARRRARPGDAGEVELLLAGGGAASLAPESVVRRAEFVVAVDAEERRAASGGMRRGGGSVVRLASAIEPEWLIDLYPERVAETVEAVWNAEGERAETVSRLLYDGLVLTEGRAGDAGGGAASEALAAAALDAGPEAFVERASLERFLARVEFAARALPEAAFPTLGETDLHAALAETCAGRRSFAELRAAVRAGELFEALRRRLTHEQTRLLASAAPERVQLSGGRQVKVNYERGKDPWIASRLQDFFGMSEGPRLARGRVPLVLHLLAPSQRPVQVTTDLAGFWQRHYPQIRRELSRRYPRHAWPEDPLQSDK
jgi:ATP-dependent helicase HrpB